jgi:hypothetical protein
MTPARAAVAAITPTTAPRIYVAEDADALGQFMAESELPAEPRAAAPSRARARRAPVLSEIVCVRISRDAVATVMVLAAGLLIGALGALEVSGLIR